MFILDIAFVKELLAEQLRLCADHQRLINIDGGVEDFASLPRNFMESLRNRGLEDLASVAVDEAEPERGGALAEATQDTRVLEPNRRHGEEIHGDQLRQVVLQEGPPRLRRRCVAPPHVLGDAGLPDLDAQFEQLTVDARRAPERIFLAQSPDQLPNLRRKDRSSRVTEAGPHRAR
jgi:hypothetical protein